MTRTKLLAVAGALAVAASLAVPSTASAGGHHYGHDGAHVVKPLIHLFGLYAYHHYRPRPEVHHHYYGPRVYHKHHRPRFHHKHHRPRFHHKHRSRHGHTAIRRPGGGKHFDRGRGGGRHFDRGRGRRGGGFAHGGRGNRHR